MRGKALIVGIVVLMIAITPTVFASGEGEQQAESEQDQIVLKLWGGIPEESGPGAMVEAFNEQNPGIHVDYVRYVNNDAGNTKLDTALLSGENVDVFYSYNKDRNISRIASGVATPLDPYLEEAGFDIEEDFGVSYGMYEGNVYALPTINADDFIWINKDMFDEAGIEIPRDWTWEEYVDIARQLTSGSGDQKVYGSMMHYPWPNMWMRPAIIELGPDLYSEETVFDFDNEYFARSLEIIDQMENVDESQVPAVLQQANKLSVQDMFFNGRVAMLYAGSWIIRYAKNQEDYSHDFITAFAPLPRWRDGDGYYNSIGALAGNILISSRTPHKDAAWRLLEFAATEGNNYMVPGGKVPAWNGADVDRVRELLLGDNAEEIFHVESFTRVLLGTGNGDHFTYPSNSSEREVVNMAKQEAEKALLGQQSVSEALHVMERKAQGIVEE